MIVMVSSCFSCLFQNPGTHTHLAAPLFSQVPGPDKHAPSYPQLLSVCQILCLCLLFATVLHFWFPVIHSESLCFCQSPVLVIFLTCPHSFVCRFSFCLSFSFDLFGSSLFSLFCHAHLGFCLVLFIVCLFQE